MSDATSQSTRIHAPPDAAGGERAEDVRKLRAGPTPYPPDRLLITRCQKGDNEGFNLLVQRYERVVFNFAYRLAGNYDDANDVAQEAFVRAYNAIHLFRGDAAFSTWIFRIATNIYLDIRKRQKDRNHVSLNEAIELEESFVNREIQDPAPTPDEIAADRERSAVIFKTIGELPDFQRAMVVLYHFENKAYEEIAEIMNLPIGTVKSRMNRARLALKDKLSEFKELI